MIDVTRRKPIRHWSVSFQVWMHVLRDTVATTSVSTTTTHTTASVAAAIS